MKKFYHKTVSLKIDPSPIRQILNRRMDAFASPFDDENSYLHVYKGTSCSTEFSLIQHLNPFGTKQKTATAYIRHLAMKLSKEGTPEQVKFLHDNFDRFVREVNEENHNMIDSTEPGVLQLMIKLTETFGYNKIVRARFVKLPAGGEMPLHVDETTSKNMRIIVPLVTDEKCINVFQENGKTYEYHFPADGSFYQINGRIAHGVQNHSDIDRYVLVFTVVGLSKLRDLDMFECAISGRSDKF